MALDPNGNYAYLTNSQSRAQQALDGFMSGGFRFISMTKAQREYMGGITEGLSPAGPVVFLVNHIEGMDTSSREYKAGLLVGILIGAGLEAGANVANVMRELTPTSQLVQQAERELKNGATEVTVKTEEEAAEVFLRNYQHEGYYNTTGMTGNEVRNDKLLFPEGKSGTYHWDFADTQHGGRPHLQVETREGQKIRIFFERRVEE